MLEDLLEELPSIFEVSLVVKTLRGLECLLRRIQLHGGGRRYYPSRHRFNELYTLEAFLFFADIDSRHKVRIIETEGLVLLLVRRKQLGKGGRQNESLAHSLIYKGLTLFRISVNETAINGF